MDIDLAAQRKSYESVIQALSQRLAALEEKVAELERTLQAATGKSRPQGHSVHEEMVNARKWRESIWRGINQDDRPALQRFFDEGGWMPPKEYR